MSELNQLLETRVLRGMLFVGVVVAYIGVLVGSLGAAMSLLGVGLSLRRLAWTGPVSGSDIEQVFIVSTTIATVFSVSGGYILYRLGA